MFNDEEERWAVCVHEAAHAVVASLGSKKVYEIAVAPVKSGEWDRDYDENDRELCFAHRVCVANQLLRHAQAAKNPESPRFFSRIAPIRLMIADPVSRAKPSIGIPVASATPPATEAILGIC